jgi:hypothetical protein
VKALRAMAAVLALAATPAVAADVAITSLDPSGLLHARYKAFKEGHGHNQFKRPLSLVSTETANGIKGEIEALVDFPFDVAGQALNGPSEWCDILILHLNTKNCRVSVDGPATTLQLAIGKKFDQPIDKAYRVDFGYRVIADSAKYLQVRLSAADGPLGTHDYRIVLEAAPADAGKTFLRMTYSYSYGMVGELAMKAYLATTGRDKVGFTVVSEESDGQPTYIRGMRGIVERNTMRYYLAIEAYLGALSGSPKARVEKALSDWFAAIERYPRQLHEMERSEYLTMKNREYARQTNGAVQPQ